MTRKKRQRKSNRRWMTKHHLCPKERIKLGTEYLDMSEDAYPRILHLWRTHHDYWHLLFGNLTLEEIISVLERIKHLKSHHS